MKILSSILTLKEKSKDRESLNFLIERAYKFSYAYLNRNRTKIKFLHLSCDDEITEMAIEAIAPLFSPDNKGNFIDLIKPFENWEPEIKTEEAAEWFLNRIVSKRVEQFIALKLRELDPVFSKILDSVNYLVKKGNYSKITFIGKRYIVPVKNISFSGELISTNNFNLIPVKHFSDKKHLLDNLFSYLCDHTDYEAAIPVNALVLKLKHISSEDYSNEKQKFDFPFRTDINEIIDSGLSFANQKLTNFYSAKKKLNAPETDSFRKALQNMAEDLKDGGLNPGLFGYLSPYMPSVDKDEYTTKYHNILEYLLKVMKSTIAEKLQE